MKKNLFFSLFALFLAACGGSESTMMGEDNDFRVANTDKITRIFIADRVGNTCKLDRQGDKWRLNDKFDARQEVVNTLLETLNKVRVRYSVSPDAQDMVNRELATQGIKVEVYQGSSKKTFYVGGGTPDQLGTYMYMEGADRAYVTHIANWEGTLTPRFVAVENDLRSRSFFNSDPATIAEISAEYPTKREHSFKAFPKQGKVEPFYVSTPASAKPLQKQLLTTFTNNLNQVKATNFILSTFMRDSILEAEPFCKFQIKSTNNSVQTLDVYEMRGRQIENTLDQFAPSSSYYVYYTGEGRKEFVLVGMTNMQNMMWSYTSFFNEPKPFKNDPKLKERRFK